MSRRRSEQINYQLICPAGRLGGCAVRTSRLADGTYIDVVERPPGCKSAQSGPDISSRGTCGLETPDDTKIMYRCPRRELGGCVIRYAVENGQPTKVIEQRGPLDCDGPTPSDVPSKNADGQLVVPPIDSYGCGRQVQPPDLRSV